MGFQSTETEVQPRPVGHGPWKPESFRITFEGRLGDGRPTGVTQSEHFLGLVESLPGGIIH